MNEAVVAKLKQLAEELWWIQEFCQTILYNHFADSIRWQPVAAELESDMVRSTNTIHSIIYCLEVRKHIQQLGSHACWCFARIDDLVTHYTFQIRLRLRNPDLKEIWTTGEELEPNGWMEVSQLAGWLSLLAGMEPLPTRQELADAANHRFKAVEREILGIVNDAGHLMTNPAIHAARKTDSDIKTTKSTVQKLVDEGFLERPRGERSGVALTIKGRLALRNTIKDSP